MSEKDPWKDVEAELLKAIGHPHVAVTDLPPDTFVARFFAARAAEATQHRQEIAAKDETIDGLRLVALGWEKQRDEARARLAAVEAERDRLQRVNECVYEVCGCGNMADAHCMICCRPLTEHRLIPTRELEEIQRRFALYAPLPSPPTPGGK